LTNGKPCPKPFKHSTISTSSRMLFQETLMTCVEKLRNNDYLEDRCHVSSGFGAFFPNSLHFEGSPSTRGALCASNLHSIRAFGVRRLEFHVVARAFCPRGKVFRQCCCVHKVFVSCRCIMSGELLRISGSLLVDTDEETNWVFQS